MKYETRNTTPQNHRRTTANPLPQLDLVTAGTVIVWGEEKSEIAAIEETEVVEVVEVVEAGKVTENLAHAGGKLAVGMAYFALGVVVFSARTLGGLLAYLGRELARKNDRNPYLRPRHNMRMPRRRSGRETGSKTIINDINVEAGGDVNIYINNSNE